MSDCAAGIGLEGGGEDFHGAGEVFFLQHIGHTHLVAAHAGGGIESRSGSHEDGVAVEVEVAQTPLAELVGVIDGKLDHGVVGAHRAGGVAAGYLVDLVDEELAALDILVVCLEHVSGGCVD